MKKLQQDLNNVLKEFINKECIKVDIPVGTILYLYFGDLVLLNGKKQNPISKKIHLSSDYLFFFEWHWKIISKSKIIASSRILDDKFYTRTLEQIQIIKDKVLLDFEYNTISNELKLYFEDGIVLQTFNDIVRAVEKNDIRKQSIFMMFTPNSIYDALANGKIEYQEHSVEYVNIELLNDPTLNDILEDFEEIAKSPQNIPNELIEVCITEFRKHVGI
ncbi:MAG: hypothetical protein RO257_01490 [Candidatus Kapabacteria bacterium]|nr:hypothetical protein [Candidatus Kapabacteria bacterium]